MDNEKILPFEERVILLNKILQKVVIAKFKNFINSNGIRIVISSKFYKNKNSIYNCLGKYFPKSKTIILYLNNIINSDYEKEYVDMINSDAIMVLLHEIRHAELHINENSPIKICLKELLSQRRKRIISSQEYIVKKNAIHSMEEIECELYTITFIAKNYKQIKKKYPNFSLEKWITRIANIRTRIEGMYGSDLTISPKNNNREFTLMDMCNDCLFVPMVENYLNIFEDKIYSKFLSFYLGDEKYKMFINKTS